MSRRRQIVIVLFAALFAAALPACALAVPPPPPAAETAYHRIDLPGGEGKSFPYTVEVPEGWQVRQVPDSPALWIGPADAEPPRDPRLIFVRLSLADVSDAEKTAATIRSNVAKGATQDATVPLVEVHDLGGVKGVLVRMDSGTGDKARSTLALKLPLEKGGVDFMASGPRAEFEKMLPTYQRILLSVRRHG